MEDVIQYVIGFVLGMLAATLLIRWLAQRAIAKFLDQIEQENESETDGQLRVDVEFEQNIYFLYNSDDGSFVAQGNDLLDLRNNLHKRFPDRTITIVKGNATAMEQLKQQIKDFNENSHSVGSTS
jgi:hypothetical protein